MALVGFNLKKINVERKALVKGEVNIKTNLKITDVVEEPAISDISKDKKPIRFDFEFSIIYDPDIAEVKFEGNVFDMESEEATRKILDNWKDKKIDDDLRLKVSTMIWQKCNTKAFQLEEDLGLPIHIPLPKLST